MQRVPLLATSAILLVAITAAAPASAGRFGGHPRRAEVNGRLFTQNQRIRAGVRDGQLTHSEASQLRSEDRGIYREERTMAGLDGGHITKADQHALNQQENVVSRQIRSERHD